MSEITFGPVEDTVTGSVQCVEVSLVNDIVTEDTEDFTVTVSSTSDNAAIASPSTATYTIEDDDCKPLLTTHNIHSLNISLTVVVVSMVESSYLVAEDSGVVTVCAELEAGALQGIDAVVILSTQSPSQSSDSSSQSSDTSVSSESTSQSSDTSVSSESTSQSSDTSVSSESTSQSSDTSVSAESTSQSSDTSVSSESTSQSSDTSVSAESTSQSSDTSVSSESTSQSSDTSDSSESTSQSSDTSDSSESSQAIPAGPSERNTN